MSEIRNQDGQPEPLPKHGELPVEDTWDLSSIFQTDADWEKAFAEAKADIHQLLAQKGKLTTASPAVVSALKSRDQIMRVIWKLFYYASLNLDVDSTVTKYQSMKQRVLVLLSEAQSASSHIIPQILAMPQDEVLAALAESEELIEDGDADAYALEISDAFRRREHILPAEAEALLLRAAAALTQTGRTVFDMWNFADRKNFGIIEDENGQKRELTQANFGGFLLSKSASVRKAAIESLFSVYAEYGNTLAAAYAGQLRSNAFYAREHKYDTVLEQYLDQVNIPASLPQTLLMVASKNISTLNHYAALRKRMLKLDVLHFQDLYVSLVDLDFRPSYHEVDELIRSADSVMGKAYLADLDRCLTSRWIDGLPCQNKRSGGYTSGSHDTAPFMLMNYLPGVDGLYTKTHEIGHMINALRSRAKQPPHLSGNPTNVAEVASTLDEHLLSDYLLRNTTDEKMRFFILCRIADGFKNTFFTQLMYHEFELAAHALVEAGGGVTREALDAIYLEKLHKYFGGAVHVDTFMGSGWSRIPHFYNAFYVWNYASSWVASTLLAQAIKHEGQPAVDRVINMLSIGSSKYPLEILHDAGIDMTNEATIQKALDYFAEVVAELEEIAVRLNFNG